MSPSSASPAAAADHQQPLWTPSSARQQRARISDYMHWLGKRQVPASFSDYPSLWQWSVEQPEAFWQSIWDYFEVESPTPASQVLSHTNMLDARWFEGSQVNYTRQVFRHSRTDRPAILFADENGAGQSLSWGALQQQVASLAFHLRELGVVAGDRVVAYLPNRPEAVVAFLACASIGAIWSISSPDMGEVGVLDRFRQIEPKVLIACGQYRYGGKTYDRRETLRNLRQALPTLRQCIVVGDGIDDALSWDNLTADDKPLQPAWLPFDHPLWIVYSSGTTGTPKAIVHGHGGIILSMSVVLGLHNDLGPDDRYHWYSSTGWIMWNCQVSGLLLGSTLCLFDGNPGYPDLGALWHFAADSRATFFGAGAAFYAACLKAGIQPAKLADLSQLRSVGSTGSPLSPECYEWIYREVGDDLWLTPMSGGTDLAGPFIGGVPILPVYAGEMQCRVLGASVEAFDEAGQPLIDEVGELVCTRPMPNMPLFFWNDASHERYRDSYYDTYPDVWRHGDWIRITPRGGAIIYGRSDATINRHGIRMGTSELYRAVEALPEILDCLVVDLEYLGKPSYMPLFVVLKDGAPLDDALRQRIESCIRTSLSARHVPNEIFAVADVPRTQSGKKLELPIKKLLMGQALDKVVNRDAVANPDCLAWYVDFAAQRAANA
ncbi:TPA: acetoacetate--CoA ligase [Pseudomonas aeruginosa]|uniref:acetoacetate--CoA ligase n=1 Tax=Pseudomonas aeruginosa TaxID=287 RepID=UPI0003B94FC6|nr:acetoacetate--CoA ligase [Pseudomonas aeruginosa]EKT9494456.1 acetoacetate--CoA ligase [Pseudomonas aeruginosa]ERY35650.1 acetoacetate-CoA ligase [Pseudomonas aeruginosa BL13]MBH4028501.1 acetoacetate--CoA ligase [Pseudomonas aeruginosa]MBV5530529.1 acetoacetate--CoA ligase [Pseudomonas aeruginosa]RTS98520.1 acetoacetate--CoA ligase [Pseudomonas aeruginosa]